MSCTRTLLVIGLSLGLGCSEGRQRALSDAYCPGEEPYPEGSTLCRSDADCSGMAYCAYTFQEDGDPEPMPCDLESPACGDVSLSCTTDDGCEAGLVCTRVDCCIADSLSPDLRCVGPCDETHVCHRRGDVCDETGHCQPPPSCEDGFACGDDQVCAPERVDRDENGCASHPCDEDHPCPAHQRCDPGPGAQPDGCRNLRCSEGAVCPVNTDCDPGAPGDGCVRRTCDDDLDCGCGVCTKGECQPRPMVCGMDGA